jgi:hypothetical protein
MVAIAVPVKADLIRLRNEFLAMPGLSLTVPQAARLLSVRESDAHALLDALVAEGLLVDAGNGIYRRVRKGLSGLPGVA